MHFSCYKLSKTVGVPYRGGYVSIFCFFLFLIIGLKTQAQRGKYDTLRVAAYITPTGDTLASEYLQEVMVTAKQPQYLKDYWANWTRLRNAVYVTYPYAIAASRIMNEINVKLVGITDMAQRKAIIKEREKELRRDFTSKLTKLSVYQGKVLMKLIARQTGNNCYEIISEYKGSFNAVLYQTIAVLFGSSLKQTYNPQAEDALMEKIVIDVQAMYGYKS